MTLPKFRSGYSVRGYSPDLVIVSHGEKHEALSGVAYFELCQLVDGTRSKAEIVADLKGCASPLTVHAMLDRLEELGLTESTPLVEEGSSCLVSDVIVFGAADFEWIRDWFSKDSVLNSCDSFANLPTLVVTDDYLFPEIADFSETARLNNRDWLIMKPTGDTAWIGPVFGSSCSWCYSCFAKRLRQNRLVENFIERYGMASYSHESARTYDSTARGVTLGIVESALKAWNLGRNHRVHDSLMVLDLNELDMQYHSVTGVSQCDGCGSGDSCLENHYTGGLRRNVKHFTSDGGHRTIHPAETFEAFRHCIDPYLGVVRSLVKVGEPDGVGAVYAAAHSFLADAGSFNQLLDGLATSSAGKGMTDAQAKAGALAEALERVSGVFRGCEPRFSATQSSLGSKAVAVDRLLQFSDDQYDSREEWNQRHSSFAWVPERFDSSRAIEWSPAWSLVNDGECFLPTAYCYYGYPLQAGHEFCRADSNGCAAGNTVEEAILQGFCELVERDSVAVWWYNMISRPRVNIDSLELPFVTEMTREYAKRNREFWVIDITGDLGIPCFVAISAVVGTAREKIIQGYGCHLDPVVALSRALSEMNQMLALLDSAGRVRSFDPDNEYWFEHASLRAQPYLVPDAEQESVVATAFKNLATNDIREDIQYCVDLVGNRGLDFIVLEQTRPDIRMPVARVVVPGLRHFWARFGSGRLYESPLAMGWLPRKKLESELNPIPISS